MKAATSLEHNLGYQFQNQLLLTQALSHRSVGKPNNERLEYLGDSILGFIIAECLYHQFPGHTEGDLTKMRARLVRRDTLAQLARGVHIQDNLRMGSGEMKSGGFNRDSILSDALEALIGAIYLDGGIEKAKQTVDRLFAELLKTISGKGLKDSKTLLQEELQKRGQLLPEYNVTGEEGEAHDLKFTVECIVPGFAQPFKGIGESRKRAEQVAAGRALEKIRGSS